MQIQVSKIRKIQKKKQFFYNKKESILIYIYIYIYIYDIYEVEASL